MKVSHKRHLLVPGLLLAVDLVFFGLTDASKVAAPLLIIGFGLVVATLYSLIFFLIGLINHYGVPIRQRRKLTLYITVVMALLLALQSSGELGSSDVLVLVPLVFIGYLYSSYVRNDKNQSRNLET